MSAAAQLAFAHRPHTPPWLGRPFAEDALAASPQPAVAIVFTPVGAAAVSSSLGYAAADHILKSFALRLRDRIPSQHPIYRWTGFSLLVLLPHQTPQEASVLGARWLPDRFLESVSWDCRLLQVPVSPRAAIVALPSGRSDRAVRSLDYAVALHSHP
ncbi:MAG: diguanylate cyclase [Bryobacteraceae bacterium]|nr:diguanylate cyclase [Bryobacteraceae bacterium]